MYTTLSAFRKNIKEFSYKRQINGGNFHMWIDVLSYVLILFRASHNVILIINFVILFYVRGTVHTIFYLNT